MIRGILPYGRSTGLKLNFQEQMYANDEKYIKNAITKQLHIFRY